MSMFHRRLHGHVPVTAAAHSELSSLKKGGEEKRRNFKTVSERSPPWKEVAAALYADGTSFPKKGGRREETEL